MKQVEKTVFISYRRTNVRWALSIFQNLTHLGYDVFFDFHGIASGDFERVILANIKARAHFLVLLTPSSLERCGDPDFRNTVSLVKLTNRLSGFDRNIVQTFEGSTVLLTEEWVYKQGRGRLTKILTVTGGILTDIRLASR